jgi:nucleotide-binding universal stress UspA family protein
MFKPKKILVATDYSEHSNMALRKAIEIAMQFDAKLTLLHVLDEKIRDAVEDSLLDDTNTEIVESLDKNVLKNAKAGLQKQLDAVRAGDKIDVDLVFKDGSPAQEILKLQKKKDIDLIVLGSHGVGGFVEYFIGSVADKVIRGASCSVLVVK